MASIAPIIEEIKSLKSQLKVAKSADETRLELMDCKIMETKLNGVKAEFCKIFDEYSSLLEFTSDAKNKDIRTIFDEFNTKFDEIISNADKGKLVLGNLVLDSLNNRFKAAVAEAWQKYLKDKIDSAFSTLILFKDFVTDYDAVVRYRSELFASKPSIPQIGDRIAKLVVACTKKVEETDADNEVKAFIAKVGKNTATVADLSPHILDWLKKHNHASKIKIQM